MNIHMFEWQKDITRWALRKGRAALFEECGNGKTIQQLEFADQVAKREGMPVLIVAPLTVGAQTLREAQKFGYSAAICRTQDDVTPGINITNYEMLQHFDGRSFAGVVLDESSILKNYTGKMRNQIIEMFKDTPYRLSCTATRTAGRTSASGWTARASATRMRTAPGTRHWATPSPCLSGTFWQSGSARNIFVLLRWVVCLTASEAFLWCSSGTTARARHAGQAKLRSFPLP